MGIPKPAVKMPITNGEKESTGGDPTPASIVLRETGHVDLQTDQQRPTIDQEVNSPAEEHGAAVVRFSSQAEAHVHPHSFWVEIKSFNQSRRSRRRVPAQRPRVGVTARRRVLQSRTGLPVRHGLPLEKTQDL